MKKHIVMDELHVTVSVAAGLRDEEYRRIRRTLRGARFRAELNRAVSRCFARFPSLMKSKVAISR